METSALSVAAASHSHFSLFRWIPPIVAFSSAPPFIPFARRNFRCSIDKGTQASTLLVFPPVPSLRNVEIDLHTPVRAYRFENLVWLVCDLHSWAASVYIAFCSRGRSCVHACATMVVSYSFDSRGDRPVMLPVGQKMREGIITLGTSFASVRRVDNVDAPQVVWSDVQAASRPTEPYVTLMEEESNHALTKARPSIHSLTRIQEYLTTRAWGASLPSRSRSGSGNSLSHRRPERNERNFSHHCSWRSPTSAILRPPRVST